MTWCCRNLPRPACVAPPVRRSRRFWVGEDIFDHQLSIELLPDNAALMTIRTFSWPEQKEFSDFTQRSFEQMKEAGTRTLIIDVRENGGGDDAM